MHRASQAIQKRSDGNGMHRTLYHLGMQQLVKLSKNLFLLDLNPLIL